VTADDARAVVAANRYMTLATADAGGRPWASPVWFATRECRDFVWVSHPDARHSLNIAARPEVALVIFDSHVEPGHGQAVYISARAQELAGEEVAQGLELFSAECVAQGLPAWVLEQVAPGALHRLYRARADEHFMLGERDERVPVALKG
jgi:nitroimidazol reductase NimA-like FMN-containing flavoprotein (pyridoxamine 5'-phosphate oxidase superfamily)